MRRWFVLFAVTVAVVAVAAEVWSGWRHLAAVRTDESFIKYQGPMKLTSSAFVSGGEIPSKYACDGRDISPPFLISGVPVEAKSLALQVDDPDAVSGVWTHWLVWNIDPSVSVIEEGQMPRGGVEGITSSGRAGWNGPCPPSGVHRYFFKIYALDAVLNLPASADVADLERAMTGHILDKAGLLGVYGRK